MSDAETTILLLEEVRLLRSELADLRADRYARRGEVIRQRLPLRLTVGEFARIVRLCEETIRRKIRSRDIAASGQPFMIPRRELDKFDVTIAEAEEVFVRDGATDSATVATMPPQEITQAAV